MGYRRPLLSELNDVDASSQADRFALVWDTEAGFHRYTELNVAAIVGLQDLLEEYSSSIGARVVANNPISGGTATKISFDEKGLVTGGTAATTADVDDSLNRRYVTDEQLELLLKTSGTNTGDQDLSGYSQIGHGHAISEITGLQTALDLKADLIGGVIPSSQLPALVKTDVFTVDSEDEMLALDAQTGDLAIRTDITKTFVHNGGDSGTDEDWSELISPTDAVTSVNGLIGAITLGYADVGAAAAIHYHTIADVTGLQTALNGKADSVHAHTISDITDLPVIAKSSTGNAIVQANATGTINDSFLPTYLVRANSTNTITKQQAFTVDNSNIASVWESTFGTKYTVLDIRAGDGANSRVAGIRLIDTATGANGRRWEFRKGDNNAFEFFYFNASGGSSKPFSIDPDAPSNSFILKTSGYAGFGTSAPIAKVHVHAGSDIQANVVDGPLAAIINAFPGSGTSDQYKDAILGLGVSVPHVYLCGGASFSNNARGRFTVRIRTDGGVFNDRFCIDYLGRSAFNHTAPKATIHGIGSTIVGAATSAVVDADLGNGQINFYLDETGHNLKVKVKYSNGTIRTATIALVA